MSNSLILFIENYYIIIQFLCLIATLLISVGIITLIERKILGNLQYRVGPSFTSLFGIFQPIMDGFKLYIKESILPILSQEDTYVNATCLSFFLSILCWVIVPLDYEYIIKDMEISFLFVLAIISLTIYSLILSGWGSNSSYPMIGAIRSASQMISYEISVSMMLVIVFFLFGSIHLIEIVNAQSYTVLAVAIFPIFIIFYVCGLAEINRLPFDLPEAESELVSGYHTEYSGIASIFFNIGEYSHVLFLAILISEFFLGGWISPIFILSSIFIEEIIYVIFEIILFVNITFFVRGLLPRFRYDQLMKLNWNIFIPLIIFFFIIC